MLELRIILSGIVRFFNNNKCISVGKTKTTDIYYKDFHVHLYECKTKPYFKTAQFDFMCKVQEEYAKEGTQVSLFTFVLGKASFV